MILQRETTEYIYIGVTGDEPTVGAEVALLPPAQRPDPADWEPAIVVDSLHPLFTDATGTGLAGDYFVAQLVGSFGGNTVAPTAGDYAVWLRLTDDVEQPVRIAPVALEVE